ncbi:MAG: translocation/assembly module TamB domain-containing protein [Ignavibacteria bacterium]|nr:translocation/assembly module TamB domain-containing protein [Ignavibacteria bacterium]
MAEEKKIENPDINKTPKAEKKSVVLKEKKKNRIFQRLVLIFFALLLFITLLLSFTQTSLFRNWLKSYAVDTINEHFAEKMSTISIGEIDGNFFSELVVKDALIKIKNDEMVKFDFVKIKYNIFGLLDKHIDVDEVVLQNPSANFFKVVTNKGDTTWNIIYLFESAKDTVEKSEEFDWKIDVKRLRINNLNYIMYGAMPYNASVLNNIKQEKSLTTENLKIGSFNFEAKAEYDKNAIKLWIDQLSFNTNFGLDLKGLSGEFYLSSSRAEINNLNIETSKSWIESEYIFIDKINLVDFGEIKGLETFKGKDKQLRLDLHAKNINFDDLKAFLPAVDFLDNEVAFDMKCKGTFDDINVESLKLRTANSNFEFAGRMKNLTEPDKLWFDVVARNLKIDPRDTKIYTPGLPIPDYSHVGIVTGDINYKGEPIDFETTFDVQSSAGNAKGFFNLNLKTPNFNYSTSVDISGGNIGKVIKNQKLESNINGHIEAIGSGFALGTANTTLKYAINDTKLLDQKIDKSQGSITLNGYNAETDVQYVSGNFDAIVKGNVNIRDFNNPVYNLKGSVKNLDISQFTKNQKDKSSLTFAFDINGRGISPERLDGTYHINLSNSYYADYNFTATPIDLKISSSGTDNYINLSSNLVDFNAKGTFKIAEIGNVIASNIEMVQNEISKKFNLDTLMPVKSLNISNSDINFTYNFKTKDPKAISKLFYADDIYFNGNVNGYIKNSANGFDGYSNIRLNEFVYKDTVFAVKNVRSELKYLNSYINYRNNPEGDFNSFNSDIKFSADTMQINKQTYDSVKTEFILGNSNQFFKMSARQDSTLAVNLKGNVNLSADTVLMILDTLFAGFNRIDVTNSDKLIVSYHPRSWRKEINFDQFELNGEFLKFNIGGAYSFADTSNLYLEARDISIPAIMDLVNNPKNLFTKKPRYDDYSVLFKGKIRRVLLTFNGKIDDPKLSMELNTSLLRYDNNKVGRVDAFIDYSNNNLAADILMSNAQGSGKLRLTGNIPYSNPFVTPDSLTYASVLEKPLDLDLKATNFQINFFSKAIPNFTDLRGFLDGEIMAKGNINAPQLSGNATITRGRLFFTWNGLYYRFESNLKTDGSDIVVERFSVYNDRDKDRHIDVFGKINFAGLKVNYIDLETRGDMYFLDGSSIQNRFGFYGEMLGGVGDPPIRIQGNLKNLLVSGQLNIKKAKLFFPAISSMAYDVYSDDFTYRILTDPSGSKFLDTTITVTEEDIGSLDPFLRYNYILEKREPTVADYITYDLDIVMEKNVLVNVNMNSLTREELNGEFTGNLKLDNRTPDRRFQLFGRMNIVGDSYYRFYKNFSINDSYLDFNGDYNNPELHIKAQYTNYRTLPDNSQEKMYVLLDITGTRYKPLLTLSLMDNSGVKQEGNDAQTKALSYLLFGAPIPVGSTALGNLGNNFGSGLASSLLYEALRNIAPWIVNTELIYTGGNLNTTDIKITSAFGDAVVKFGGKILSNINNFEVSVEYPLNKLLNFDISNNLLIQISRSRATTFDLSGSTDFESRAGLSYKIRY